MHHNILIICSCGHCGAVIEINVLDYSVHCCQSMDSLAHHMHMHSVGVE